MLDKDREDIERLHEAEYKSKKKYSNIRKREKWLERHPVILELIILILKGLPIFLFLIIIIILYFMSNYLI